MEPCGRPWVAIRDRAEPHIPSCSAVGDRQSCKRQGPPSDRHWLVLQKAVLPSTSRILLTVHNQERGKPSSIYIFTFAQDSEVNPGDITVLALGFSTPILLRQEGTRGKYWFVSDLYILMGRGRTVDDWKAGKRALENYVLHRGE